VEENLQDSLFGEVVEPYRNSGLISSLGTLGAAAATTLTHVLWSIVVTVMNRWHERRRSRGAER
jgi:hypothetical protein